MKHAYSRFEAVCAKVGIDSFGYFQLLDQAYSNPDRHYHNWNHIESVVDRATVLAHENGLDLVETEKDSILFAGFWHDAVYVPGFNKNEELSAFLALEHFTSKKYWSATFAEQICDSILSTKNHQPKSIVEAVLCDADLYELASYKYWVNRDNVRKEFAAATDEQWIAGRKNFLVTYLNHDKLFHLAGQQHLEILARANMREELEMLNNA